MSLAEPAVTIIVVYSVATGPTRAMGMAPWSVEMGFATPRACQTWFLSGGRILFIIMTPIEELQYLANLTCEACKWRIAEGDTRSGLEMEVEERLKNLNERIKVKEKGVFYCTAEALEGHEEAYNQANKSNKKYSDKFAETHRRVSVNGVTKWYSLDKLEQVPTPNSRTGYKWMLKNKATEASDVEA